MRALAERSAPPDAFGNAAHEYELGRPRWPQELIDRVVRELELAADATVLDLGAGTGKLTRDLVPRFARVIAVEPDDAMRVVFEEVVPEAEALAGSAEAIPLDADSVDAVFSAEAFHWFASDETVAEIARVLRPRALARDHALGQLDRLAVGRGAAGACNGPARACSRRRVSLADPYDRLLGSA